MASPIVFAPLSRTTPTLWSHMRLCGLRGAFASLRKADRWVLHDPRGWLGTAFHRVMEAAVHVGASVQEAETVWNASVADAATTAASHPLDARFGAPERWPGYFLIRQRALASAKEAAARACRPGTRSSQASPGRPPGAERWLEARGGRLAGRPDRFDGRTVTEYKSSLPDPARPGAQEVLEGFRRQLRLYAAIVAETTGRWPAQGRVVAASGQTMKVPLLPTACEAEAASALSALDMVNGALASGAAAEAIAEPSPPACGGCPYQALCPAFWRWLGRGGPQGLPEAAAEGVLDSMELGHDGDLYTARLAVSSASHAIRIHQELVLRRSAHGDLTASLAGARLRIVSGRVRPDGRLRADLSTAVFVVSTLPALTTG